MGRGALLDLLMATVGIIVVAAIASVPLEARDQAIFAGGTMLVFLVANKFAGRPMTMFLVALSLAVSSRYMLWRVTETLKFGSWTEMFFGVGLAFAELYALIVLVLGYVQCTWPLDRKPLPLPKNPPCCGIYL